MTSSMKAEFSKLNIFLPSFAAQKTFSKTWLTGETITIISSKFCRRNLMKHSDNTALLFL